MKTKHESPQEQPLSVLPVSRSPRIIKYRGKSKYKSNPWITGFFLEDENKQRFIGFKPDDDDFQLTPVAYESVGQFTGLKDKNGKEIYEGDLLSDRYPIDAEDLSKGYHESFLPVVWCSETGSWAVDASFAKDGSFLTSMIEYFGEFLEVKGNIYENADLRTS